MYLRVDINIIKLFFSCAVYVKMNTSEFDYLKILPKEKLNSFQTSINISLFIYKDSVYPIYNLINFYVI